MTRSQAREIAIHIIFELGFSSENAQTLLNERLTSDRFAQMEGECDLYDRFPNEKQEKYIRALVNGVFAHGPELDEYISRYAKGWSFSRIPRVAAAIMRTAMYEVLYMPDIPNGAAINDAVEIAKGYEDREIVSFVNGILGSFAREEFGDIVEKSSRQRANVTDAAEAEAVNKADTTAAVDTNDSADATEPAEAVDAADTAEE